MELKPLKIRDRIIEIPIIQGGMGVGISMSRLAGNVSLNGGLGVISAAQIGFKTEGYYENPLETNLKALKDEIIKAKEIAKGAMVGINIMVATRYYERYVKAAVEAGVDIIISGAGLPTELPEYVKGSKTLIAPIVSSLKSASVMLKMWDRKYKRCPDLLVIEGPLAGGHLGFKKEQLENIEALNYDNEIKNIVEFTKEYSGKYDYSIPVALAGGINDREDAKHAMELGVDGIQVASRFVTTKECDASEEYKNAYIKAEEKDIVIVKSPVGMPGRAIRNSFMEKIENGSADRSSLFGKCFQCIEKCDRNSIPYCISQALVNAAKGDVDNGLLFCGKKAYLQNKIETVKEVMDSLCW